MGTGIINLGGNPLMNNQQVIELLTQLVVGQEKQNQLLANLVAILAKTPQQQANSLQEWQAAHPELAKACQDATTVLGRVQSKFLERLTQEILENEDDLVDGDFILREFTDQHGQRLAHLNGVIAVISQLGAVQG